jgi:hypothetical protein
VVTRNRPRALLLATRHMALQAADENGLSMPALLNPHWPANSFRSPPRTCTTTGSWLASKSLQMDETVVKGGDGILTVVKRKTKLWLH